MHDASATVGSRCTGDAQVAATNDSRGSASAGRPRDLTAVELTYKLSNPTADIRGWQWTTLKRRPRP